MTQETMSFWMAPSALLAFLLAFLLIHFIALAL